MPSPLPPASEAWRTSITARITAVNDLLEMAAADLTLEQMNHVERKGVLPIAFSLIHVVGGQDRNISKFVTRTPSLWQSGDWKKKVGLAGEPPMRGTPMADAEKIRFGNADAWRQYQSAVFAQTESLLAMLVPSGTIRVREVIEAYIFQHAARHLGEIEHARALVGLGGMS